MEKPLLNIVVKSTGIFIDCTSNNQRHFGFISNEVLMDFIKPKQGENGQTEAA